MALLLSLLVIALASCQCLASPSTTSSSTRRFAVRYHSSTEKATLLRSLKDAGYSVVAHFDRQQAVAVVHPAHHESDEVHSERLAAIPGVHFAERDHERYHMATRTSTEGACGSGEDTCKWKNVPVNKTAKINDIIPYGIRMTQANDPALNHLRSTKDTGVLICIVDGGADAKNKDFEKSYLRGCTSDSDLQTGFQCPFDWSSDESGHGTHVTGTIAAEEDSFGVVGVIPGGADIFHVKVFNGSCNPNYGCGPVYGTSLVEAFQACEDHLHAMQYQDISKRWTMVVSMSLGGPGPVTLEQMYFEMAGKHNDILWVAAAGNDQLPPGQPQKGIGYPAGYREVMSVAAVDCNEERASFSQINTDVEISGPGVDVTSDIRSGSVEPSLVSVTVSPPVNISLANAGALGGVSPNFTAGGVVTATGPLVYCGLALDNCTGVQGAICLILRGQIGFDAKLGSCKAGGGIGAMIYNAPSDDPSLNCVLPPWGPGGVVPGQDNGGTEGWVPSVKLSYDQGAALLAMLNNSQAVTATITLKTVETSTYTISGTSMATPHVAGAAARVWSAYPKCGASDVRVALRAAAKPLGTFAAGKNRNSEYGFGLVQVKDTLMELKKATCAKKKSSGRKLR